MSEAFTHIMLMVEQRSSSIVNRLGYTNTHTITSAFCTKMPTGLFTKW